MRRDISIALLVLYVGLFTDLNQVFKLPILVEHFQEHRSQVPGMTFFQFLVMHYKTDVPHDSTDMELPFKDCSHSVTVASLAMPEQKVTIAVPLIDEGPAFSSNHLSFVPDSCLDDIFQPPKA